MRSWGSHIASLSLSVFLSTVKAMGGVSQGWCEGHGAIRCGKGVAWCLAHSRCSIKGPFLSYTAGGEAKMAQPLWKAVWQVLQRLNRATVWPCNCTLRYITNRNENTGVQRTCPPTGTAALFKIPQRQKQPERPPAGEGTPEV